MNKSKKIFPKTLSLAPASSRKLFIWIAKFSLLSLVNTGNVTDFVEAIFY